MSNRRLPSLAILLLLVLPAASGATTTEELRWTCWLGSRPDFALHCLLDGEPRLDSAVATAPAALETAPVPVDQAQIRRALFAAGAAPNVARLVRQQPALYAKLLWSIPLHGPPIDDVRLLELARSVLCGSAPRCTTQIDTASARLRTAAR